MAKSAFVQAALLLGLIFSAVPASAGENDVCIIKGNVSTQGERIYHIQERADTHSECQRY